VRALFRDGGGVFGNSGFSVRHSGESFLRLVGARRFITRVATKCKGIVGRLKHKSSRGERLAMAMQVLAHAHPNCSAFKSKEKR
jgi:hypothetical protein